MNILSVDWDYFIKIPSNDSIFIQHLFREYRIGNSKKLTDAIPCTLWKALYKEKPELDKVSFLKGEYSALLKIILGQKENIPFMIVDSHELAYSFIKRYSLFHPNIYNVDYHHDIYTHCKTMNCGNWLRYLIEEKHVSEAWWINGNNRGRTPNIIKRLSSISDIANMAFDAVFICKSQDYSLPKYDKYFLELVSYIKKKSSNIVNEEEYLYKDRWVSIAG